MQPAKAILPIAAHVAGLRSHFPFGNTTWNRFELNWQGTLAPSVFGRNYDVELAYKLGKFPEVWVRNPKLSVFAGKRPLPHTYDQELQRLCLFKPGTKFWTPHRALAVTLLPWACLWLYYFEFWLVTDEWAGSGEHPAPRQVLQKTTPVPRTVMLF